MMQRLRSHKHQHLCDVVQIQDGKITGKTRILPSFCSGSTGESDSDAYCTPGTRDAFCVTCAAVVYVYLFLLAGWWGGSDK